MTKHELLQLLEPFSDDIEFEVRMGQTCLPILEAGYVLINGIGIIQLRAGHFAMHQSHVSSTRSLKQEEPPHDI